MRLFTAFLLGVQEQHELTMNEIWAARPALQLAILERIVTTLTDGFGDTPSWSTVCARLPNRVGRTCSPR